MGRLGGLLSHSLHASVMVGFAVFLATKNGQNGVASRLLQVDATTKEQAELEMLRESSQVSLIFSAVFFFFVAIYIMNSVLESDLSIVQRSVMKKRLEYCMFINLYICFFSCLFNLVQFGDEDDVPLPLAETRDEAVLDLGRPIEWILTCPLMQLCLPIFAGEKVPDYRRTSMPVNAFVALNIAMCAMLAPTLPIKLGLFMFGLGAFSVLVYQMNRCIVEASEGQENMLKGKSPVRTIVLITTSTWIPFPVWYALSPEGFNIIKNVAGMRIAVAFLNVFSKGVFIFYLNRVREDLVTKDKVLLEINGMKEIDGRKSDEAQNIDKKLGIIMAQVLLSMGRQADHDKLTEIMEQNLICTCEDVTVLTKSYCDSIGLPWALVFATKQKIRASKVENGDAWSIVTDNKERDLAELSAFDPVSPKPLPPQVANDPRKLREAQRRLESKYMDDGMSTSNPPTQSTIPAISLAPEYARNPSGPLYSDRSPLPMSGGEDPFANERENINKIYGNVMEELQAMRNQAKLDSERKDHDMAMLSEKVTDNVNQMMEQMMNQVQQVLSEKLRDPNRDMAGKRVNSRQQ